jgi:hypothetical protein
MDTREAKDFLVRHAADQAAREGLSLSPLETKMMYFTESDIAWHGDLDRRAGPFGPHYEAKISTLLHHVHNRLRKEDPRKRAVWDQAIRTLENGDHYLLALWDRAPYGEQPEKNLLSRVWQSLSLVRPRR